MPLKRTLPLHPFIKILFVQFMIEHRKHIARLLKHHSLLSNEGETRRRKEFSSASLRSLLLAGGQPFVA